MTFHSILPIFLLILAGYGLRRMAFFDDSTWPGLDNVNYWILYPALLFVTIMTADFSGLRLDALLVVLLLGIVAFMGLVVACWPPTSYLNLIRRSEFSSVFQSAVRWNGFMAFAIAQNMFGPAGTAVVALVMAAIIAPLNIASVAVITHFAGTSADFRHTLKALAINPFILSVLGAVLLRLLRLDLYEPLIETLNLVGAAALGIGLLGVGAGLRMGDLAGMRFVIWFPAALKLLAFPAFMIALALAFGITGTQLQYLALCAAVPTAMNGYLLARQLGGDAELYAAITTMQTALSFFSIPLVLAVAVQLSSG